MEGEPLEAGRSIRGPLPKTREGDVGKQLLGCQKEKGERSWAEGGVGRISYLFRW